MSHLNGQSGMGARSKTYPTPRTSTNVRPKHSTGVEPGIQSAMGRVEKCDTKREKSRFKELLYQCSPKSYIEALFFITVLAGLGSFIFYQSWVVFFMILVVVAAGCGFVKLKDVDLVELIKALNPFKKSEGPKPNAD